MDENQIPEDLRRFILIKIPSVPCLEALLILRRDSQKSWSAQLMAQRLYIDEKQAADVLAGLTAEGLVAYDETAAAYRYAPADATESQMIDRLAGLYSRALVAVTNLIHRRSAQLFAEAFKLRKD